MNTIRKREIQGYFYTSVGYVFIGVFLIISSILFYVSILRTRSGELPNFIYTMSYLWMLLCPILTMRLLAEEKQKKTDQLLLTALRRKYGEAELEPLDDSAEQSAHDEVLARLS